jgi:hypothetical protein
MRSILYGLGPYFTENPDIFEFSYSLNAMVTCIACGATFWSKMAKPLQKGA